MGRTAKALALLSGVALAATPAWPLGLAFLLLSIWSLRPGKGNRPRERHVHLRPRHIVAGLSFLTAFAARALGGQLSPVVFGLVGVVVLSWPWLVSSLLAEVSSVEGSILLRSRFLPFSWYSISEAKASSDELPRSMAHFTGDLLVRMDVHAVYLISRCLSLTREGAQRKLVADLGSTAESVSCGIFPMDSDSSVGLLSRQMRPVKGSERVPGDFDTVAGALLLKVKRGRVRRHVIFELERAGKPQVPALRGDSAHSSHLLWEVLGTLGKGAPWPGPDSLSSFIESVRSTKGEPLGERIAELESSGPSVRVRALGGEEVEVPRPSLSALIEIYP
ncbi:MAG TPA: hypothetical protein VFE91_07225 [Nitrososphaerales archaeon]|nr:hypothetical protein [Nitrososphaerales archaeon]